MICLLCEWVVICSDTKPIGAADIIILPLFCDITEFPIYFTLGSLKKQFSSPLIYKNFVRVHSITNASHITCMIKYVRKLTEVLRSQSEWSNCTKCTVTSSKRTYKLLFKDFCVILLHKYQVVTGN